jgi:hypothetical protein
LIFTSSMMTDICVLKTISSLCRIMGRIVDVI